MLYNVCVAPSGEKTYIAGTRSSRLLTRTRAVTALNLVVRRKVVTDFFSGPGVALDSVCVCVCACALAYA